MFLKTVIGRCHLTQGAFVAVAVCSCSSLMRVRRSCYPWIAHNCQHYFDVLVRNEFVSCLLLTRLGRGRGLPAICQILTHLRSLGSHYIFIYRYSFGQTVKQRQSPCSSAFVRGDRFINPLSFCRFHT